MIKSEQSRRQFLRLAGTGMAASLMGVGTRADRVKHRQGRKNVVLKSEIRDLKLEVRDNLNWGWLRIPYENSNSKRPWR